MLDVERQYYDDNLPSLLEHYRGRFVVIKDHTVLGPFNTIEEALREGARTYGVQSFLARQVGEPPRVVSNPALDLGVLHADPTFAVRGASDESPRANRSSQS
jgi:hypothetical protein